MDHLFSGHNVFPLIHINFIRVWNRIEIYALFGVIYFLYIYFVKVRLYFYNKIKKKSLNIFLENKLENFIL